MLFIHQIDDNKCEIWNRLNVLRGPPYWLQFMDVLTLYDGVGRLWIPDSHTGYKHTYLYLYWMCLVRSFCCVYCLSHSLQAYLKPSCIDWIWFVRWLCCAYCLSHWLQQYLTPSCTDWICLDTFEYLIERRLAMRHLNIWHISKIYDISKLRIYWSCRTCSIIY